MSNNKYLKGFIAYFLNNYSNYRITGTSFAPSRLFFTE